MSKTQVKFSKILLAALIFAGYGLQVTSYELFAQQSDELEFTLDLAANTTALPRVFRPGVDLSGRGFHRDTSWPQGVAAPEVLGAWQEDIGFNGMFRLQYNLWEINETAKNKKEQDELLSNYETIIKNISDAGGVVILDIFSTPAGLGKVLDRKSPPWDMRAFKELVKGHIKNLSCNKRYNIWYEVWSAPDSEDFFLGRKQEYLNLYRVVAEVVNELQLESKVHIPLGGPSTSAWFHNIDENTIVNPERSLIYELIKFCYRYRLPLDFISWHSYSTDPKLEKEATIYNKSAIALIRDWLSFFRFDRNTPLIVDEWNYDNGINVAPERAESSHICASYILGRIKNMYEAGLDYQLYYCLEDFQANKEGVVRNVGMFWFDPESSGYKGGPKAAYSLFRILAKLGDEAYPLSPKNKDEFVDALAAKTQIQGAVTILIYNYIDPELATNYLSRNIAGLNRAERKVIIGLLKSDRLAKIMGHALDVSSLHTTNKAKALLRKARELNDKAIKFKNLARNVKLNIKNLKENYLYQRYVIDSSCGLSCNLGPVEEKEIAPGAALYNEALTLAPYSVIAITLKKPKPAEKQAEPAAPVPAAVPEAQAGQADVSGPGSSIAANAAMPAEAKDLAAPSKE